MTRKGEPASPPTLWSARKNAGAYPRITAYQALIRFAG
jgi:hypothetical protein